MLFPAKATSDWFEGQGWPVRGRTLRSERKGGEAPRGRRASIAGWEAASNCGRFRLYKRKHWAQATRSQFAKMVNFDHHSQRTQHFRRRRRRICRRISNQHTLQRQHRAGAVQSGRPRSDRGAGEGRPANHFRVDSAHSNWRTAITLFRIERQLLPGRRWHCGEKASKMIFGNIPALNVELKTRSTAVQRTFLVGRSSTAWTLETQRKVILAHFDLLPLFGQR